MLKLAAIFGDDAVLQRDRAIPVWGWCAPYRRVRATLGDAKCETRSGADGKFLFRFPPMRAARQLELQILEQESGETVVSKNLAIGEVWLASGQSNMEFRVSGLADGGAALRAEAEAGKLDGVRMLTVPHNAQLLPEPDVDAKWQTATAETVNDWSAVALYFARRLAEKLQVTVGILSSSWGGTIAEAWTSRETLVRNPDIAPELEKYERSINQPEYWEELPPELLKVPSVMQEPIQFDNLPPEPPNSGAEKGWAESSFDDSGWERAVMPAQWRAFGIHTNGTVWFRRQIEIPEEWAGRDLVLSLGSVDKHDITCFDGIEIGRTGKGYETEHWDVCRVYRIPGKLVKPGVRTIAVRDYSFIFDGGLNGPAEKMTLRPADAQHDVIPLAGEWRFRIETDLGPAQPLSASPGLGNPNSYSILFDSMIYPLLPTALRGVIWYQGESNALRANQYERLMRDLIADWRCHFAQGEIPFLQVILAGFRPAADFDPDANWPLIREAQIRAARETGNLVASAVDAGDARDIHPKDKKTVGDRLAAAALAQVYGGGEEGSGPLFHSAARSGRALLVSFDHAEGWNVPGGKVLGFRIAGRDGKFHPAQAVIAGDQIAVSSPEVPEPVALRYAWSDNPAMANLCNAAGLPALPFRFDG